MEQIANANANINSNTIEGTFTANVTNVLEIVSKSLYTNKEIFLRELISNGSDAIGKVIKLGNKYKTDNSIRISMNKQEKTVTVRDSGIGMTKEDLIKKLCSIGTSGTKEFKESNDLSNVQIQNNLIGQFGVGFYSVYLVASHIQIITKPVEENKIWEWKSESFSSYSIRELTEYVDDAGDEDFTRGTKIILTIKPEEEEEFINQDRLIDIIKTHSKHNAHLILFEKHDKEKGEIFWEKLNLEPIWLRPKSEISQEQYDYFYKNLDCNKEQSITDPPILTIHVKLRGEVNCNILLFVPHRAPFNAFESSVNGKNIQLITNGVKITDDSHSNFIPTWMQFLKGIVDTNEIELNVSRQTIQDSKKLRKVTNMVTNKFLEMIEELMVTDNEKFLQFYNHFAPYIKNGIHEESSRDCRDYNERNIGKNFAKRLIKMLRFNTSKNRFIGFDEYVRTMKPDQKGIYYNSGATKDDLEQSPFMDKLVSSNYEVFYFVDPIDEYIKAYFGEYHTDTGRIIGNSDDGYNRWDKPDLNDMSVKVFVDITRDDLLLPIQEDEITKAQGDELCNTLKPAYESLGIKLFDIKTDDKFDTIPGMIVNHVHLSAQLEKLLKNNPNTMRDKQYAQAFERKDLLISKNNKVIKYLYEKLCVDKVDWKNPTITSILKHIHSCGLLAGGYDLPNPNEFVKSSIDFMCLSFEKI